MILGVDAALATADIVAATVRALAEHEHLLTALRDARRVAPDDVFARWGLAVHGAAPTDPDPA